MDQITQPVEQLNKKAKALFIVGEVNEQMGLEVLKTIFETDWKNDGYSELTIYISSEGGSLPSCFAMIDAINFVKEAFGVHVTTFGLGEAASAGFFLLLTGDTRAIFPNCMVFVHEHLTIAADAKSYSEIKKEDKDQDKIYSMYIEFTAQMLKISPRKVKALLKKNRYLTLKELKQYNIITSEDGKQNE
jgi:ATP-dependent protease ClpP protease subunit